MSTDLVLSNNFARCYHTPPTTETNWFIKLLNLPETDTLKSSLEIVRRYSNMFYRYLTRFRNIILLILLAVPLGAITLAQDEMPNAWESVGEGIQYEEFRLTNPVPVNVFVADIA